MGQKSLNAFIYAQKQAIVVFNTSRGGFMGNVNLKTDSKLPWWKVVIGILVALLLWLPQQLKRIWSTITFWQGFGIAFGLMACICADTCCTSGIVYKFDEVNDL